MLKIRKNLFFNCMQQVQTTLHVTIRRMFVSCICCCLFAFCCDDVYTIVIIYCWLGWYVISGVANKLVVTRKLRWSSLENFVSIGPFVWKQCTFLCMRDEDRRRMREIFHFGNDFFDPVGEQKIWKLVQWYFVNLPPWQEVGIPAWCYHYFVVPRSDKRLTWHDRDMCQRVVHSWWYLHVLYYLYLYL